MEAAAKPGTVALDRRGYRLNKRLLIQDCVFGELTAIEHVGFKSRMSVWRCRCSCGNECLRYAAHLVFAVRHPDNRHYTSRLHCGCKKSYLGFSQDPGYALWKKVFANLCREWQSFPAFRDQCLSTRAGRSLCRQDVSKPYGPSNYFWSEHPQTWHDSRAYAVQVLMLDQRMSKADAEDRVASVSRQRVSQFIAKHEGRCIVCGKPRGCRASECDACARASADHTKEKRSLEA